MTLQGSITVTFQALELRIPDMAGRLVEGIVVPWDETSFMTPDPRGERFRRGSLTKTVKERKIKLFRNHNHEHAVGEPVDWKPNHEAGCWVQYRLYDTPAGQEVLHEVREGALDAFSVGFVPVRETRGADGAREIIEAKLGEVSICPMGAYDGARVLAMRTPRPALLAPLPEPEVDFTPVILPPPWRNG